MPRDRNSIGAVTRKETNAGGRSASFSRWRRERPFWGGALAIIAGLEIYSAAAAPISVMAMQGLPGLLTICVALVAVIMGAVTLFQPVQRVITGWVILVLGPISILATNLGGFVIGMIMLVVGGALILSWQPVGAGATATPALTPEAAGVPAATAVTADTRVDEPVASYPESDETYTEPVGYGHAAEPTPADSSSAGGGPDEAAPVEAEPEPATRNPWRRQPVAEPVGAEPVSAEPAAEPVAAEPVAAEPVAAEPAALPVEEPAVEPVAPQPAFIDPVPDLETTATRNPWRSRTPPPVEPAPAEPAPVAERSEAERSETERSEAERSDPERPRDARLAPVPGDAGAPGPTRSWFGAGTQLPPMESPKNLVRTTLLIPLILVSIAMSGLLAAPAAQAQAAAQTCLIPILCPADPTPTPTPSAAPSATPSSGLTLPTLPDVNLIPGTGDKATTPATPATSDTTAALPGAECPTKAPAGTTSGGQAAIDGAAAIQACKAAGETATISAQEATGTPPEISNTIAELKSPRLEMEGFAYDGVKTLSSPKGPVKVLAFSLSKLTVDSMDQTNGFGTGANNVRIADSDGKVVISGNVKLYVTSMTGSIYGLITLTFTPDFAPPLVLPSMFFTNTTSQVALVQADKITLPSLTISAK